MAYPPFLANLFRHIEQIGDFETEVPPQIPAPFDIVEGVAVIPIQGALMNGADAVDKFFGFTNHEEIANSIEVAASQGRNIVLDIDSPGGTHNGTPELANVVQEAAQKVKVVSHTSTMRASAAEYISDFASRIVATPSAKVGSIGTIIEHVDISEMLSKQGIKVEQFASGEMKGAGSPLVPLTDSQRANVQETVNKVGKDFQDHVMAGRGVSRDILDGRTFFGEEAAQNGMVNGLVQNIGEAISIANE